jgi:hypothetical protein
VEHRTVRYGAYDKSVAFKRAEALFSINLVFKIAFTVILHSLFRQDAHVSCNKDYGRPVAMQGVLQTNQKVHVLLGEAVKMTLGLCIRYTTSQAYFTSFRRVIHKPMGPEWGRT